MIEGRTIAGLLQDDAEDAGGAARPTDVEIRFGSVAGCIVRVNSDSTNAQRKGSGLA